MIHLGIYCTWRGNHWVHWGVGSGDRFSKGAGLSLGDLFLPFCIQFFWVPVFHAVVILIFLSSSGLKIPKF